MKYEDEMNEMERMMKSDEYTYEDVENFALFLSQFLPEE